MTDLLMELSDSQMDESSSDETPNLQRLVYFQQPRPTAVVPDDALTASSSHTQTSHSSVSFENSFNQSFNGFSEHFKFQPIEAVEEEPQQEVPLAGVAHYSALNFVAEHRIFLKAALDLLTERDRQAPQLGMMDPIVLKAGSLKKASHVNGVWKVKFVEIRRGMFSYYENVVSDAEGELLRKDIPLEAASCHCRAVKLHQKALNFTPGGAIFELSVNGSKRLWMAKTRADRQLWISTISQAMVGGSVTRGDATLDDRGSVWGVSPRSPFKSDLRHYVKVQSVLRSAKTKSDYVGGLRTLTEQASLKVPVKWIVKQGALNPESHEIAFREETVDLSVDQLWRDLARDSVTINGENFCGDAGNGPERIVGALAREILGIGRKEGRSDLPESQALAYARDILLSGNRTRSGGDSYFCVQTLCNNPELVVVVPSGAEVEPVMIDVIKDESDVWSRVVEKSGWIRTRNKSQKEWRKLFFVLSEGTLSFYESALPRPHKLRGQIVLTDTTVTVSKMEPEPESKIPVQFVMTLAKEGLAGKEWLLLFGSEDRLLDWTYALECTTKLKALSDAARKHHRRRSSRDDDVPSSRLEILNQAEQVTKEKAMALGLDEEIVEGRLAVYARRAASSMVISIRACTEYNICTLDPQGDESEDTWATLRAHFLQNFRVQGGPNGRILRGEELVRVSVKDCLDVGQVATMDLPEEPGSPRRSQNRRIFRRFSTSEDQVEDTQKAPTFE